MDLSRNWNKIRHYHLNWNYWNFRYLRKSNYYYLMSLEYYRCIARTPVSFDFELGSRGTLG